MASFDSATSGSFGGAGPHTLTNVTVGNNGNRVLDIFVVVGNTTVTVSSVTRNGQSASLVQRSVAPAELALEVWRIIAPTVGTADVVVTKSGSASENVVGALSVFNVDQTTPNGTIGTDIGASEGSWSLNVTTASTDEIVVDVLGVSTSGKNMTPGAGQTERIDNATITWRTLAVSTAPGTGGTVTMTQAITGGGNDNGGNVYLAWKYLHSAGAAPSTQAPRSLHQYRMR